MVLPRDLPPFGAGTRVLLGTLTVPESGDQVLVKLPAGSHAFERFDPDHTKNIIAVVLTAVAPMKGGMA